MNTPNDATRKGDTMNSTNKATPRPWSVCDTSIVAVNGRNEKCLAVIEDDGGYEAPPEERESNAALIVKAVNEYDALNMVVESARACLTVGQVVGTSKGFLTEALAQLAALRAKEGK